ncbi:MAG: isopeptide-forming domain-containing fimbrial protein [Subdoligranulum variabile]|nr:isopeptide-forming domain-containing fimbrial protein [Subdoligranulum variabile]
MKTAKRLLTAALAVVFTFMCALPAMADDTTPADPKYTLTIDNPAAGHTYEAYQIFAGTFSKGTVKNEKNEDVTESYLSDINWGSGVITSDKDYAAMIDALKNATPTLYDNGETLLAGVNDATKVAVALNNNNNAATADIFNEIIGAHLTDKFVTATAVEGKMVFANLTPGYYLVKDKDNSLAGKENESYTKYLVKLVDSTDISVKGQTMDLEKVILENNTAVKANNAAMGETVSYKLTSKTSTMDGYEDYTYIIHDEMDGGLTFNGLDNMTVTVGGEDYKANCEVTYSTDGTNYSETNTAKPGEKLYIQIKLKDLVKNGKTDQDVVVTYTATVNAKAVIGSAPNTNTAYLEYSNNPNQSQNGHSSTAKTPEKHVYTYVAGFEISKVSPADKLLPGAQFMIEGKDVTIVKLNVIGYSFEEAGEGSYYHVDNSYTTAAQTNYTGAMYDAKYGTIEKDGPQVVGMTSDKDEENGDKTVGTLRFNGLKEGTYTITEVLAPTGYKKLDKPITVKIDWTAPNLEKGETVCKWTYDVSSEEKNVVTSTETDNSHYKIVNQHGLTLPFTGGEGANLLAGLGLALMAAAVAAILYIKRRQNRE